MCVCVCVYVCVNITMYVSWGHICNVYRSMYIHVYVCKFQKDR